MLSILIPVYNWSVVDLIQYLYKQCQQEKIAFEIRILDDNSKEQWKQKNRHLRTRPNIHYEELTQNVGRAKIRNLLAQKAKYSYLLFLDADAAEGRSTFIKNYLVHLELKSVIYGGSFYSEHKPLDTAKLLHYYYGKNREVLTVEQRNQAPYDAFKTFNFLIPKSIFMDIQFDESIREYGHEDTLFGLELKKRKTPILHIDNPLEHAGLENFDTFLAKQKKALENLYQLYNNNISIDSKLINTYKKLKQWHLTYIVFFLLQYTQNYICKQLKRQPSNLFFLDLYKLHYWLQLDN